MLCDTKNMQSQKNGRIPPHQYHLFEDTLTMEEGTKNENIIEIRSSKTCWKSVTYPKAVKEVKDAPCNYNIIVDCYKQSNDTRRNADTT